MKVLRLGVPIAAFAIVGLGVLWRAKRAMPAPNNGSVAEVAFDAASGLGTGWRDLGWAPREVVAGKPTKLDLADRAGWILSRKGLTGSFGAVLLRYSAPEQYGDFLEIRLDSSRPVVLPKVPITREMRKPLAGGWTEAVVPMSLLDPTGVAFDQIVIRARLEVGHQPVYIERVALTVGPPTPEPRVGMESHPANPTGSPSGGGRAVRYVVDCRAPARPISPFIYGIAGSDKSGYQWGMGITAVRWGGNPTSRYNWQRGDAYNTGADWFFRNVSLADGPGSAHDRRLQENQAHGVATALTVPTIGWVSKDTTSYSFPVSVFGPQEQVAPELPDAGNGKTKAGRPIAPGSPTRTSVAAPPEFIGRWLQSIRATEEKRGRTLKMVILDNEPMAWHTTHRDVHPNPLGYDELLDRTIKYGTAVRRAYPDVLIAGPAEWGWTAYFYSAIDTVAGVGSAPDRRAHSNLPLIPWYLAKLRAHEKKTGVKLLDVLDVHYYPQGANIGIERSGGTDSATSALRLRSTRSLWDPTYTDESWINDRVQLIPRMHRWVKENAPGLGTSLGEYNFGAADHQSGGLAQAEALGRFGSEGLTSAFYWFLPPMNSPVYWAFRAYRNFDGNGGRFLDLSVPVKGQGERASLFVSRSEKGDHLVAVLLNLDPDDGLSAELDLSRCAPSYKERVFTYTGGPAGFAAGRASQLGGGILRRTVAPYSMTVLDLTAP